MHSVIHACQDQHVSWFCPEGVKKLTAPATAKSRHYGGYFDEPLDYYDDEYASTVDSDTDDLLIDDDERDDTVPGGGPIHVPAAAAAAAVQYRHRVIELSRGHDSHIGKWAPSDCEITMFD